MLRQKNSPNAAFTLVEIIVAMTIGSFLLVSAYATIMSLAKGSQSVINFTEMNTQTRFALEWFGRDSRMAEDVIAADVNRTLLVVNGVQVEYRFEPSAKTLFRTEGTSSPKAILYDVDDLLFNYYTLRHGDTKTPLEVKHIQLEAKLERRVLQIANTNYIISARFMMRNKNVSN